LCEINIKLSSVTESLNHRHIFQAATLC